MVKPNPPRGKPQPYAANQSLSFSWLPPLNDGGSAITAYTVTVYGDPGYSGVVVQDGAGPNDRVKTLGAPYISNGVMYYCTLVATNADGTSDAFYFRPFQAGTLPGPPASASATKSGSQSVLVTWTPGTTADATIFWYVITAYNQSTGAVQTRVTANGLTQSTYELHNLPFGTYEFRVQSVNCPGYSPPTITNTVTLANSLLYYLQGSSWTTGGVWPATVGSNASLEDGTAQNNGDLNALYLNGSTCWQFPDVGSLSNFTVNVWWKDEGTALSGVSPCIITQVFTGSPLNFSITTNEAGVSSPNFGGGFYGGPWYFGTPFTLPNNTWINIQYTYDGSNLVTYINGSSIGSVSTGGAIASGGGQPYRIGRRWDNPEYMTGFIGEVRIYSTALSASDILAAYNESHSKFP